MLTFMTFAHLNNKKYHLLLINVTEYELINI